MFSRPVSSGWMPDLISISDPMRPCVRIVPAQGSVIREISFSIVDLPLPFGPTIPTASPSRTANETSASAQMLEIAPPPSPPLRPERSMAAVSCPANVRFFVTPLRRSPSLNRFHTCSTSTMGRPASDDIGERPVDPLVPPVGETHRDERDDGRGADGPPRGPFAVRHRAPEPIHQRRERVEVRICLRPEAVQHTALQAHETWDPLARSDHL